MCSLELTHDAAELVAYMIVLGAVGTTLNFFILVFLTVYILRKS